MQLRLFVFPILFLTGVGCAGVIVVSSLGLLNVTDRPSHLLELFVSSVMLIVVIIFVLAIARMRTACHGPMIWRHYGVLRSKQKLLVNLTEADEAHVYPASAGQYQTIHLDFLNADRDVIAVGPSLPHFTHSNQQKFHDHLARYVRVTGEWKLVRSTYIQTSTHPPHPSA